MFQSMDALVEEAVRNKRFPAVSNQISGTGADGRRVSYRGILIPSGIISPTNHYRGRYVLERNDSGLLAFPTLRVGILPRPFVIITRGFNPRIMSHWNEVILNEYGKPTHSYLELAEPNREERWGLYDPNIRVHKDVLKDVFAPLVKLYAKIWESMEKISLGSSAYATP